MSLNVVFTSILILLMLANQIQAVDNVMVDAAITYPDETIGLIAGDKILYMMYDQELNVGDLSEIHQHGEFPVKAAVGTDSPMDFMLYGPSAAYYVEPAIETLRYEYRGPWAEFFKGEGPDAAARRGDRYFFFKDCMVASTSDRTLADFKHRNAKKLGLPCKPDAAWYTEGRSKIVVLKGDQIWLWEGGRKVDGPHPFSSKYTITSWELLP